MPRFSRLSGWPRWLARQLAPTRDRYEPDSYWEGRAEELIKIYDHPEQWEARGWMRGGIEEKFVPEVLARRRARSVVVVGAGSGRQYEYLVPVVDRVYGLDISPRLVAECRRRYPQVTTEVDTIVGAAARHPASDAVLSSAVLQHVHPDQIHCAVGSVKSLAHDVVILRELTMLELPSAYQWAHDYHRMFDNWSLISSVVTDERPGVRVELLAFARGPTSA